ncbi:hypothetical protein N0B51_00045 [Tsuneonella sp. YG55]|uniref:Uncharacterized protein n=1 Tax=Tsuneonella litorea TaxID=2976475 RepID=A0A9X2VZN4_9SPHN|nr:hypothetical protein [Tsuneonella litorea]MCT2557366.1 hypothetical protein [Tsuneonella litorea]
MTERRAPPILSAGDRLQAQPHHVRALVLDLLDQMSAPMTARQIEAALIEAGGWTRAERRRIVKALKVLPIVAIGAG